VRLDGVESDPSTGDVGDLLGRREACLREHVRERVVISSLADQLCAHPAAVIADLDRDEAAALLSS
jgi:hypothetical protein